MSWLKTIGSELFGLFVDDGTFALAILAWIGVAWVVLPRLGASAALPPILLFIGLVAILAESAIRRARTR